MTIAERPHSLEEHIISPVSEIPRVSEMVQPQNSFEAAHVREILQDLHNALGKRDIDANMFVVQTSSAEIADVAISIPQDVRSKPRPIEVVPITRGFVLYNDEGAIKGIGFDAFSNGSIRAIAGRTNETGAVAWRLLKDLSSEEKVRSTGTWKDAGTGIEIPIFERAGDTVVKIADGDWQQGRAAQAQLRNHINPTLPKDINLPDYANKYLPTKAVKK